MIVFFLHFKVVVVEKMWQKQGEKTRLYGMTAWPHGSPLLSSTTLSLPSNKTSDYYRHLTQFSFKTEVNSGKNNYYAYF